MNAQQLLSVEEVGVLASSAPMIVTEVAEAEVVEVVLTHAHRIEMEFRNLSLVVRQVLVIRAPAVLLVIQDAQTEAIVIFVRVPVLLPQLVLLAHGPLVQEVPKQELIIVEMKKHHKLVVPKWFVPSVPGPLVQEVPKQELIIVEMKKHHKRVVQCQFKTEDGVIGESVVLRAGTQAHKLVHATAQPLREGGQIVQDLLRNLATVIVKFNKAQHSEFNQTFSPASK